MNRSTAYRRAKRQNVINRKKKIIHEQNDYWFYKYEGELDKGKIFCSCPMCRQKSYDGASISDIRKFNDAVDQMENIPADVGNRSIHMTYRNWGCPREQSGDL